MIKDLLNYERFDFATDNNNWLFTVDFLVFQFLCDFIGCLNVMLGRPNFNFWNVD